MASSDLEYFSTRAREERQRAHAATDPHIRSVHLEMARRYEMAAGQTRFTHELSSSRDAIARSLQLLKQTNPHCSTPVADAG